MLNVKHGSVFDSKCDLLILPCDSNGGVTSWVEQEILSQDLPFNKNKIPFGKVYFIQVSNYKKSDFVGYAASVNHITVSSSLDSIESIVNEISYFCSTNNCTIVNIPLLGTGAGQLDHLDVLRLYDSIIGKTKIEFNTYIPDLYIAALFTDVSNKSLTNVVDYTNPRVFISYCRKNKEIYNWVTELATKLRGNGVDAILDKFHLKPGIDLPQWMTNEVLKAQKVLLICDTYYAERADMRNAGVGWETMVIQGDMLTQGENSSKYIAIACEGFDKSIPIYMKTKLALAKEDVDTDFNSLLSYIFELDIAPDIGEIPQWIKQKLMKQLNNVNNTDTVSPAKNEKVKAYSK